MKVIALTISTEELLTKNEIVFKEIMGENVKLIDIAEGVDNITYVNNRHNIALTDSYKKIGDCNVETVNDDETISSILHIMLINETSRLLLVTSKELDKDFTASTD